VRTGVIEWGEPDALYATEGLYRLIDAACERSSVAASSNLDPAC
jgi:hypothetical protein